MKLIKELGSKTGELYCEIQSVVSSKEDAGVLTVTGYANKAYNDEGQEIKDRDGDVILPSAYDLTNFKKNPIILYQHNSAEPIGKATALQVTSKGFEIVAEIHKEMHPVAYAGIKAGILKTFSIGFRGKDGKYNADTDTFYYTEVEMLETSVVSVPANADSVFSVVDSPCTDGLCMFAISGLTNKGFDTPTQLEGKTWKDVDKAVLKEAALGSTNEEFVDDLYLLVKDYSDSETFKFPHHEVVGEALKLNKGGLQSAFSAFKGAVGEGILSLEERELGITHLYGHYRELAMADIITEVPQDLEKMVNDIKGEQVEIKELAEDLTTAIGNLNTAIAGIQQAQGTETQDGDNSEGDGDNSAEGDGDGTDGGTQEVTIEQSMEILRDSLTGDNLDSVIEFYDSFGDALNEEVNNRINSEE